MDNEEIEVVENETLIHSITTKAVETAVGALVGVAVTTLASILMKRVVAKFSKTDVVEVPVTEK